MLAQAFFLLTRAKISRYDAYVSRELFQIAQRGIYKAEKPVRDSDYRRFIKRLPCVACLKSWGIDPAHTGPHGIGQKACDLKCIPLCRRCHDAFDAAPRDFAIAHQLDVPALIAQFKQFYFQKLKRRVA